METDLDRKARELAELQDEIEGRNDGKRQDRFLTGDETRQDQERRRRGRSGLSALELFLLDPVYARAYQRAWDALNDAQERVDQALLEVTARIDQLRAMLADLDARAVKLPDGTPVFLDAEHRWRTADGRHPPPRITAGLVPSADSPSWEDRYNLWLALDALQNRLRILTGHAEKLDEGRSRMRDDDNPLSMEELEGFAAEMDAFAKGADTPGLTQRFNKVPTDQPPQFTLDLDAYAPRS